MLDERLSLVAAMYEPCQWGADIGTDHAYLPRYLLKSGICAHMIAADVSEGALANARATLTRSHLLDRSELVLADGLRALSHPCGCVSITGMGGETMAAIIRAGAEKLAGAVLVLSAHTEPELVRQAIQDVGYHFVREELCRAAGRFYVCWRAEAGAHTMSEDEIHFGSLLWQSGSPLLPEYAAWRRNVAQKRLAGLRAAAIQDSESLHAMAHEVAFYESKLEVLTC